jgi:hypothetical protein
LITFYLIIYWRDREDKIKKKTKSYERGAEENEEMNKITIQNAQVWSQMFNISLTSLHFLQLPLNHLLEDCYNNLNKKKMKNNMILLKYILKRVWHTKLYIWFAPNNLCKSDANEMIDNSLSRNFETWIWIAHPYQAYQSIILPPIFIIRKSFVF